MTSAPPGTAERIRNLDLSLLIVGFEGLTRASSLAFDNFDADEELALENAWYIYAFCDLWKSHSQRIGVFGMTNLLVQGCPS